MPVAHPRLYRYVAVDENCRERLMETPGVPPERLRTVLNAVDLARFHPRGPLPPAPARALVFSNYARRETHLPAVQAACRRAGLPLDVVGAGAGLGSDRPEDILGRYDLVFAKARCALEALAVGCAVILCDYAGSGPMVKAGEIDALRRWNLGIRTLREPLDAGSLLREIRRYDPADAARVSHFIRSTAGLDAMVDGLIAIYREAIEEHARRPAAPEEEIRAWGEYVRLLQERIREWDRAYAELEGFRSSRLLHMWDRILGAPAIGPLVRRLTGSRRLV